MLTVTYLKTWSATESHSLMSAYLKIKLQDNFILLDFHITTIYNLPAFPKR